MFNAGSVVGYLRLNTDEFSINLLKARTSLHSLSGDFNKAGAGMQALQFGAFALGTAIVGIGTALVHATQQANAFAIAVKNVTTIVDTSKISVGDISNAILTMDSSLGDSIELANGLYEVFSAIDNIDLKGAMDIVEQAGKFAIAGLTTIPKSVDFLTSVINAYGQGVYSAKQISDVFFETVRIGKITGDQLARSIGKTIPLFSQMGVGIEELGAGLATLTKVGVTSHQATTQLNAIMAAFLKPSKAMAKAITNLHEEGVKTAQDFIQKHGLTGALELVKKLTQESGIPIGKLFTNMNAVRGISGLLTQNMELFNDALENTSNQLKEGGATDTAFKKQEITWKTLQNEIGKTNIIVGTAGKIFADEMAVGLTKSTKSLNEFLLSSKGLTTIANIFDGIKNSIDFVVTYYKLLTDSFKSETIENLTDSFNRLGKNSDTLKVIVKGLLTPLAFLVSIFQTGVIAVAGFVTEMIDFVNVGIKAKNVLTSLVDTSSKWTKEDQKRLELLRQMTGEVTDLSKVYNGYTEDMFELQALEKKRFDEGTKGADKFKNAVIEFQDSTSQLSDDFLHTWSDMGKSMSTDMVKNLDTLFKAVEKFSTKTATADKLMNLLLPTDRIKQGQEELLDDTSTWAERYWDAIRAEWLNGGEEVVEVTKTIYDNLDELSKSLELNTEDTFTRLAKYFVAFSKGMKPTVGNVLGFFHTVLQAMGESLNEISNFINKSYQNDLDKLKAKSEEEQRILDKKYEEQKDATEVKYESDKRALEDSLSGGFITQAQYDLQLQALNRQHEDAKLAQQKQYEAEQIEQKKKTAQKQYEIEKEMFYTNQAFAYADVWIKAGQAIMSIWAAMAGAGPVGWVIAGVMSAVMTGVAIAQTVLIYNQKPPSTPAFKDSGIMQGKSGVDQNLGFFSAGELILNEAHQDVIADKLRAKQQMNERYIMINLMLRDKVIAQIQYDQQRKEAIAR